MGGHGHWGSTDCYKTRTIHRPIQFPPYNLNLTRDLDFLHPTNITKYAPTGGYRNCLVIGDAKLHMVGQIAPILPTMI